MEEQVFRPGDLVTLRSGSPVMTIATAETEESGIIDGETFVFCVWFNANGEKQDGKFEKKSLIRYEDKNLPNNGFFTFPL